MAFFVLLLGSAGCASVTRAEAGLVGVARRGVAGWSAREVVRGEEAGREYQARRRALDEAFDADVRGRQAQGQAIDAVWVIEARRGYSAGVDALTKAEWAARQAAEAARADAAATDAALTRLEKLLGVRLEIEEWIPNLIFRQRSEP